MRAFFAIDKHHSPNRFSTDQDQLLENLRFQFLQLATEWYVCFCWARLQRQRSMCMFTCKMHESGERHTRTHLEVWRLNWLFEALHCACLQRCFPGDFWRKQELIYRDLAKQFATTPCMSCVPHTIQKRPVCLWLVATVVILDWLPKVIENVCRQKHSLILGLAEADEMHFYTKLAFIHFNHKWFRMIMAFCLVAATSVGASKADLRI